MTVRKRQRLPAFDYARAGAYFVTVCLLPRLPLFGAVNGDAVALTPFGEIVATDLRNLPNRKPGAAVDLFVVMPDHAHAIFVLDGTIALSTVVGGLKAGTAAAINRRRATPGARLWQRGFFDHVIRDEHDFDRVREYIATNPTRWTMKHRSP